MRKKYKDNTTADLVSEVGTIVYEEHRNGLYFIIMRGPASFCAYVGIPVKHPLAWQGYDDLPVQAHGGLTFSSKGKDKWPESYYWYGWDYSHLGDKSIFYSIDDSEKNWTIKEIIDDSWGTLYDFEKLMKLAEQIYNKK